LRYCAGYKGEWGWNFDGHSHLDELQTRLRSTIMVRRLKADVLTDLPAKRRQVIVLPSNGAAALIEAERAASARHEADLFAAQVAVELAKAGDDEQAYKDAVAKVRGVVQTAFTEMAKLRHDTALAKVPAVVERVLDATGKVVIMAHHKDVIAGIRAGLEEEHPGSVVTLTGDDGMTDRQESVDRFQNDPACKYFIGSIRAAGVGITLTASSHVVFAELDWTPGMMSQAEDRCHRIGQRDSVLVQHLVLDQSLDANLATTLVAKQEVIDKALDEATEIKATQPFEHNVDVEFDLDAMLQVAHAALAQEKAREEEDRAQAAEWAAQAAERAEQARRDAQGERIERALTRQDLDEAAIQLSDDQMASIHAGLRILDGANQDRASEQNGVGYNKVDTGVGAALAALPELSKRQAALGASILRKYRRQLGDELHQRILGEFPQ
jgi:hypothetical protein